MDDALVRPSPDKAAACAWTEANTERLDLRTGPARRHVLRDARAAEEIAIHHADVIRGRRSTHYAGGAEYARTRDQCLAALTTAIGKSHGIEASQVAAAVGERDLRLDAAVLLTVAVLFAIAANGFARRLFARFPADE